MAIMITKDGVKSYSWKELIDCSIDNAKDKLFDWGFSLVSDAIGYNGYREIVFSKVGRRVETILFQQQEWLVKDVFVYELKEMPKKPFE